MGLKMGDEGGTGYLWRIEISKEKWDADRTIRVHLAHASHSYTVGLPLRARRIVKCDISGPWMLRRIPVEANV